MGATRSDGWAGARLHNCLIKIEDGITHRMGGRPLTAEDLMNEQHRRAFLEMLRDPDEQVWQLAIEGLRQLAREYEWDRGEESDRFVDWLIEMATQSHNVLRRAGLTALTQNWS